MPPFSGFDWRLLPVQFPWCCSTCICLEEIWLELWTIINRHSTLWGYQKKCSNNVITFFSLFFSFLNRKCNEKFVLLTWTNNTHCGAKPCKAQSRAEANCKFLFSVMVFFVLIWMLSENNVAFFNYNLLHLTVDIMSLKINERWQWVIHVYNMHQKWHNTNYEHMGCV